jgi:hypothetical protein
VQALVQGQAELGLVRPSHLNLNYLNQFPVKNHPTALAFPDRLKVRVEQLGVVLAQVVLPLRAAQVEQPVAVLVLPEVVAAQNDLEY